MDSGIQAAIIAGIFLIFVEGGKLFVKYRKERKKPDLSDLDYEDILSENIEKIYERFKPFRLSYFAFHNGEKTYDGYSMKNVSMMVERNSENVDDIITDMQRVPVITFKRNIVLMRKCKKDYPIAISYENRYSDRVAALNKAYNTNTLIFCRIDNFKRKNTWSGFIVLSFEEIEKQFSDKDLTFLIFEIGKINEKISSLKK